jgi:hypothetical protein
MLAESSGIPGPVHVGIHIDEESYPASLPSSHHRLGFDQCGDANVGMLLGNCAGERHGRADRGVSEQHVVESRGAGRFQLQRSGAFGLRDAGLPQLPHGPAELGGLEVRSPALDGANQFERDGDVAGDLVGRDQQRRAANRLEAR